MDNIIQVHINSYMNAYKFTVNWPDRNSSLDESSIYAQYNRDWLFSCSYSHFGQLKRNRTIGVTSKNPVNKYIYEFIYELQY